LGVDKVLIDKELYKFYDYLLSCFPNKSIYINFENLDILRKLFEIEKEKGINAYDLVLSFGFNFVEFVELDKNSKNDKIEKVKILEEELRSLYPDGVVSRLNPKLYSRIHILAKKNNMNIFQYINTLTFKNDEKFKYVYVKKKEEKTDKMIEDHLRELFPDGTVFCFRKQNQKLWSSIFNLAKIKKLTTKEYFESLNYNENQKFKYVNKRHRDIVVDKEKKNQHREILIDIFPNGIVIGVELQKHKNVLKKLNIESKVERKSLVEYIKSINYEKDKKFEFKYVY
jgi:hypothetical protein